MFAQVIHGKVVDADGLRRQMKRWAEELRPGATGFLGSTFGVTDDGSFVAVARFTSADAARANSNRPEQDAWWRGVEPTVTDVEFSDCDTVQTMLGGGSDRAGFVQVMRGRVLDSTAFTAMMEDATAIEQFMKAERPDVIGEFYADHGDGTYTDVVYFTSEAEARAAEAREMSPAAKEMFDQFMAASEVTRFLDLRDPMLVGPAAR